MRPVDVRYISEAFTRCGEELASLQDELRTADHESHANRVSKMQAQLERLKDDVFQA